MDRYRLWHARFCGAMAVMLGGMSALAGYFLAGIFVVLIGAGMISISIAVEMRQSKP